MKYALVISGQPRFAKLAFNYTYKHLIESTQADVYFHTWWEEDMIGTQYPSHARSVLFDEDMLVTPTILEELIEMYKPLSYNYNSYNEFKHFKTNQFQYYTQYAAAELVRLSGIQYDVVIRTRFDLAIGQEIDFSIDDAVWVASCCPYTDGRVNDMFSVSNYENFLKISGTYLNLAEFDAMGKGDMEWALASQIQKENLTIRKFKADYETFDIIRSTTRSRFSS